MLFRISGVSFTKVRAWDEVENCTRGLQESSMISYTIPWKLRLESEETGSKCLVEKK